MSRNVQEFQWTEDRIRAAQLVADGRMRDEDIAATVGITIRQLTRWKALPEFMARVQRILTEACLRIEEQGIREKVNRVRALNDRWLKLQEVIAQRAKDPRMQDVPGGSTGYVILEPMLIKVFRAAIGFDGEEEASLTPLKDSVIVYKQSVDFPLLRELREIEKQVAQELGQWSDGKSTLDINILINQLAEEQNWTVDEKKLALLESQRALKVLRSASA